jgi:protein disulfide-isomerase A6
MRLSASLFAAFVAVVGASNVLELTPSNFDTIIGQGKPGLVELSVSFAFVALLC